MAKKRLLSSGELADELGISRRSISRYAERGWITPEFVSPGNRYFWDLDDVKRQLKMSER